LQLSENAMKEACQVPVKKKRPPGKPERRVAKIKIIFLIFFTGRKPFF